MKAIFLSVLFIMGCLVSCRNSSFLNLGDTGRQIGPIFYGLKDVIPDPWRENRLLLSVHDDTLGGLIVSMDFNGQASDTLRIGDAAAETICFFKMSRSESLLIIADDNRLLQLDRSGNLAFFREPSTFSDGERIVNMAYVPTAGVNSGNLFLVLDKSKRPRRLIRITPDKQIVPVIDGLKKIKDMVYHPRSGKLLFIGEKQGKLRGGTQFSIGLFELNGNKLDTVNFIALPKSFGISVYPIRPSYTFVPLLNSRCSFLLARSTHTGYDNAGGFLYGINCGKSQPGLIPILSRPENIKKIVPVYDSENRLKKLVLLIYEYADVNSYAGHFSREKLVSYVLE
ncbi:MAG: hypothetical protein Kow0042_28340 [Calditrichia bacterium]